MTNILKAFMLDLREEGFGYAVKRMACRINPYAQLRDAREWVGDQREIIEALAQDVVQLERDYAALAGRNERLERDYAALRAEKEEPVILTGNRPEDGASQTAKGLVQSMPWDAKSIMLDDWVDPDTREQSIQAAKLLHPLLFKKNNKKR